MRLVRFFFVCLKDTLGIRQMKRPNRSAFRMLRQPMTEHKSRQLLVSIIHCRLSGLPNYFLERPVYVLYTNIMIIIEWKQETASTGRHVYQNDITI